MNEIIEKRSRRGKIFDLGNGLFRAEIGNHFHCLKNGLWIPTDTSIDSEAGQDEDTTLNFVVKNRANAMEYDIKFGKNDIVWMKVKHLPTNKIIVFKPKLNNNNPDYTLSGNKLYVSQAWDGIDMEIFVSDFGTKTNYIITSSVGQRVVEFKVSGDLQAFRVSAPFYEVDGEMVVVPSSFSSDVMSYDFRNVPIGTKIDPTVTLDESYSEGAWTYVRTGANWATIIGSGDASTVAEATTGAVRVARIVAPTLACSRGFFGFDTSSLEDAYVVSEAKLIVKAHTLSPAADSVVVQKSNAVDIGNVSSWGAVTGPIGSVVSIAGKSVDDTITLDIPVTAINKEGITYLFTRNYENDYLNSAPSSETQRFYAYGPADATPGNRAYLTVNYNAVVTNSSKADFKFKSSNPFRTFGWK
jgi:hypothetical protein